MSVLDGDHLIAAYLDHVGKPEQVAVSSSAVGIIRIQELLHALTPLKPLLLSDALFRQLSTVESPIGVMAVVSTPRPLIVPAHLPLTIRLGRRREGEVPRVLVSLDGRTGCELQVGDEVRVRRAETPLRLLLPPGRHFFEVLRRKLKWGQR